MSAATESDAPASDAQMIQTLARLEDRDIRALTRPMNTVVDDPDTWGDDEVAVYHKGRQHIVNVVTQSCDCEDFHYRDVACQHIRRAWYATGRREIPAGIDIEALDEPLRDQLDDLQEGDDA